MFYTLILLPKYKSITPQIFFKYIVTVVLLDFTKLIDTDSSFFKRFTASNPLIFIKYNTFLNTHAKYRMSFSLGKRFENLIIIALKRQCAKKNLFLTDFIAITLTRFINHLRYWSQIRLLLFFFIPGPNFVNQHHKI